MENKKATIVDVAKMAGVSVATVSRVVNGNYPVRPSTRSRVQAAIEALEYVPNVQARELNTRHSSTIGVVVPGLYNMFFAEVAGGIEQALRGANFSMLLSCAQSDPRQEMHCIDDLIGRNVSGVIVISPNTAGIREDFYERLAQRLPVVFINSYSAVEGISYVGNDERAGARVALEYLWQLGHRRIMLVRGEHSDSYTVKEEAYRSFMQEHDVFEERLIVDIGEGNGENTVLHTSEQLVGVLAESQPTALLCCNDLMAVGAMNACHHLHLSIPRDISIAGYDNIALASYVEPQLTTMDQNMHRLGAEAAGVLIEHIHGGKARQVILPNHLIERASTGQVPKEL